MRTMVILFLSLEQAVHDNLSHMATSLSKVSYSTEPCNNHIPRVDQYNGHSTSIKARDSDLALKHIIIHLDVDLGQMQLDRIATRLLQQKLWLWRNQNLDMVILVVNQFFEPLGDHIVQGYPGSNQFLEAFVCA